MSMILVAQKWLVRMEKRYYNQERVNAETYRLINVVNTDSRTIMAVCERLADELETNGHKPTKFKGDLFHTDLGNLVVIHNSDTEEDEFERKKYLEELHLIVTGKEKTYDKNN